MPEVTKYRNEIVFIDREGTSHDLRIPKNEYEWDRLKQGCFDEFKRGKNAKL